jgi:sugar lactone lactonase YvrE
MAEPHVLMTGIAFGESPRWHAGRLWFADWGAGEILAVDAAGAAEVVLRVDFPAFPLCFDWLPDGRLLVVSGQGRLLRHEPDGTLVTHADLGALAGPDHPWNEIVLGGHGCAYVNNAGFAFPRGEFAPGSIAALTPDGEARRVAEGLAFPNGMAVTPDGATLICAESYGRCLTAFAIGPGGTLSDRRVWADLGDGVPDGICIDAEGAVWYGDVPNRRCVRVREGGEVLQTIALDRGCFACALGGEDGATLFMVATEWTGTDTMAAGERTGQILTVRAPAPRP